MKMNRKAAAFITAGLMAISLCVPASFSVSAEGETANSITITPAKEGTHNYKAYQIFKGTLSGGETNPLDSEPKPTPYVLSDIKWGDNAAENFLEELKKDNSFKPSETADNIFKDAATAEDVAKILKGYADNSDVAIAFAKFAGEHTKGDAEAADAEAPYFMNNLAAGYYLVKDEAEITDSTPRTLNLLRVVGAVEVTTKEDLPTLDKKITAPNPKDEGKANAVNIGDSVTYELTSRVPNMQGYTKYFFVVNDDLAEGLTFDGADKVAITVGGNEIKNTAAKTYYTVQEGTAAEGHSFQIVFNSFYENFKNNANDVIKITYSATLNEKAKTDTTGNLNTANLTYSNNPNVASSGQPDSPDEPDGDDPKGKTPPSQTKTYSANLKIFKYEKVKNGETESEQKLTGAKFRLTSKDGSKKVILISGQAYEKDDAGTWYMLTDGTFTDTAPVEGAANAKYEKNSAGGYDKYKLVTNVVKTTEKENICTEAYVDADGYLTFNGLGQGTYLIEELVAPEGYNKLASPVEVTITDGDHSFDDGPVWTVSDNATIDNNTATARLEIENKAGSTLPSTGGIGTKLFFIFGAVMAIGSGIYLVTKKRMAGIEE